MLLLELFVVLVGRVEKDIPLLLPPAAPPVKVEQLLFIHDSKHSAFEQVISHLADFLHCCRTSSFSARLIAEIVRLQALDLLHSDKLRAVDRVVRHLEV